MVVLGGVTRLTGSGLSIVQWKPIHGTLPPLNAQAWEEEFAAYRATPEYIKKNAHMQLADFKGIFWLEYWHRVLGRIIGMAFLLPAFYYAWRKSLPPAFIKRNFLLVGLVAAQGLMGWLMVKSGLVDNPHVSHYRLAAHLLLATGIATVLYVTIYQVKIHMGCGIGNFSAPHLRGSSRGEVQSTESDAWGRGNISPHHSASDIRPCFMCSPSRGEQQRDTLSEQRTIILCILCLLIAQITYGAFVAGLKAGYIYNEFPLMAGQFFPPEQWVMQPAWRNLLEHHATVQFIHRWLGCAVLVAMLWQYVRVRSSAALCVVLVASAQVGLGIATLLSGV
jgi:cytochrome c oxidase assembly protein subunit 15